MALPDHTQRRSCAVTVNTSLGELAKADSLVKHHIHDKHKIFGEKFQPVWWSHAPSEKSHLLRRSAFRETRERELFCSNYGYTCTPSSFLACRTRRIKNKACVLFKLSSFVSGQLPQHGPLYIIFIL